ncbi:periplasmic heavy metal sensor [bacterium]|nr:periplasmic heavy metal sensor [bacterium]PJA73596.1 MAG: hypothetical protein CO151_12905 [bacterium CG_4_9_14_3_um_filter_65_15]
MKKYGLIILLLLSVGLNLGLGYRLRRGTAEVKEQTPVSLEGQHREFPRGEPDSLWQRGMMDRRLRHMTEALNLRPQQVRALQDIQRQSGGTVRGRGRDLFEMRRRMRELLMTPQPDPDQVRSVIQAMGRRQAQLDSLVTETIMQEMAVLDPDQREAYLEMLPMGGGRFGGRSRGPGPRKPQ